ncbi:hypothetical protein [uncultured Duncaniella sp.]|uniref:hypothetical protein n=1 Tax=uncultured Duncaniella sp. TaxID=2768039 RepID=UPI00263703BB|nr:hypothetical protein [uncultured Duncaniella sp.]
MKNTRYNTVETIENASLATNNVSSNVKPSDFVSRRFYAYMMKRVAETCRIVADDGNLQEGTKKLIDNYICKGIIGSEGKGSRPLVTPEMMLIFTVLRPEIDRAMARSAAARRRAEKRRNNCDRGNHKLEITESGTNDCMIKSASNHEIPNIEDTIDIPSCKEKCVIPDTPSIPSHADSDKCLMTCRQRGNLGNAPKRWNRVRIKDIFDTKAQNNTRNKRL